MTTRTPRSDILTNLQVEFEKYNLDNGMDVILHTDRNLPIVAVNLWYHVGSAREVKGKSGFAHLFEHMMFQGSEHIDSGGHFKVIEEAGGTLNGSTSADRTNYWAVVPKNYLETILWLESDRMGWLLPAMTQKKLDNQRDVVMNERKQNYDNRPYGLAFEILSRALYPDSHPYSWTTIGSLEDIEQANLEDVKQFFTSYYGPNNASICIGGDIDVPRTKELIEKYFGIIPAGPKPPAVSPDIPNPKNVPRIVHEDSVQLPRLYLAWHTSYVFGPDDADIDVLSDLLAHGKNSRLYKSLIYEQQIAQDVNAYHLSRELGSVIIISATAKPGIGLTDLESAVRTELERLMRDGTTEREIERIRNMHASTFVNSLQRIGGFYGVTDRLNEYNTFLGDPGFINKDLGRYLSVEKNHIREVAGKYLQADNCIVLSVVPKGRADLQAA